MNLPKAELTPDDPEKLPPARRRRARRLLAPLDSDERSSALQSLAHRTSPSFDFFLFSLFSGAVIACGLLLDAPAVLVLGAALAPLMAPAVGVSLGTVIGSVRFFFRSLIGLFFGSAIVFMTGTLAGYASHSMEASPYNQAHVHTQLSWAGFLLLAAGAILTTLSVVRFPPSLRTYDARPLISVALAYSLYIPLSSAGFGLSAGLSHVWPDGLVVYAVYLAWAALLGAVTLALLGFRPLTIFGYSLGGVVTLVGVIMMIGMTGASAVFGAQVALPTPVPSATFTPTPTYTRTPTLTPSLTPTLTPTQTLTPTSTRTPTLTPTPSPTPVYGLINSSAESGGAHLRTEPGFSAPSKKALLNGTLIQILPETVEIEGYVWVRVLVPPENEEGWILQTLITVSTPPPED